MHGSPCGFSGSSPAHCDSTLMLEAKIPDGDKVLWSRPGLLYLGLHRLMVSCPTISTRQCFLPAASPVDENICLWPSLGTLFGQLLLDELSHPDSFEMHHHPHSHPKQPMTDGCRGTNPGPLVSRQNNSVVQLTF